MPRNNRTDIREATHRNVLVARFSAIGDVAMTVPVLYSACRCYPGVTFHLITRPTMTSIFVNPPANLHLIGVDVKHDYVGVRGMWRLLKELREECHIDCFIDLHAVLRTYFLGAFCSMAGIPVSRINKGRNHKRALTRKRNKVMLPLISSRARYREAFYRMGLPLTEKFDGLYGTAKAPEGIFSGITPPKRSDERWVGIAPFAKHKGKIYPPEMMEQVVEQLSADPRVKIFLFGGGDDERRLLGQWASRYPRVISLAEKRHGFPVELALLSHLDVMLSMDSANMHLASLVNIPVVSVWGATHPYCGFKGWRQSEATTIQLPMTCRPCSVFGDKPCHRGDYQCLRGISPAMITAKLSPFLS